MAASVPIWVRFKPAAAKNNGNRPHDIPSLRLLTKPAWLTLDRLRSPSVVCQKMLLGAARCDGGARFDRDVLRGLTGEERQTETCRDEGDTEIEGLRPQRCTAPR